MIGENIDSIDNRSHMLPFPSLVTEDCIKYRQYTGDIIHWSKGYNRKAFIMAVLTCSFFWCWVLVAVLPTVRLTGCADAATVTDRRVDVRHRGGQSGESVGSSPVARRLNALENTVSGLEGRIQELDQRNRELELAVLVGSPKPPKNGEKELRQLVEQLERGLTYLFPDFSKRAAPEETVTPEERNTRERIEVLRDYLSNRAAELAALRPDRVTEFSRADDDGDSVPDLGMVGLALQQLSNENAELRKKLEELSKRITLSTQVRQRENADDETVNAVKGMLGVDEEDRFLEEAERARTADTRKSAFSVSSTHSQHGSSSQMQSLNFDVNISNKGGDFNFNNNSFVCRIPGFYFFSYTLRTYSNRILGIALMKNNELQVATNTDEAMRSISSTQSTILRLSAGDSVWLRMPASANYAVYSDQFHYTTFSGFLVFSAAN
ncbi:uncharacterized protein LOC110981640 [Acanthaster planci]|uniref:Uncharacterized protein LOC110981640 n=1 Tax=Acanthaster planci TaxID=133434 RepID=A0A8B7YQU9_ACAPL|nr:uncharacterized protein LOC110981640 [Acanthaster planci]